MSEKRLTYPEIERLIWIDQQIKDNKYPNTNKIAQHLSITTKTAQRAIDFMRDRLKYPLEYCPKNRGWYYTEEPKHKLALIHLSEGDLVAILLAEKLARQYRSTAIGEKLKKAFDKVMLSLSETVSIDMETLSQAYSFEASVAAELNYEILDKLGQAIAQKLCIQMVYFTARSGSVSSRQVAPYHLRNHQGEWYLIGFDLGKEKILVFHAARIQKLEVLEEKFTYPPDFDLKKYLEDGFLMVRGEKLFNVELIFDEYQARWIRERAPLHPSEQREELPNQQLKITMQVTALDSIKRFVMQYGSHVQVIKPVELQQEILQEITQMQKFYQ